MSALEKAARAVVESAVPFGENTPLKDHWTCAGIDALRAALEAEAGWETYATDHNMRNGFVFRDIRQRRPLVDYSRDQASAPFLSCGEATMTELEKAAREMVEALDRCHNDPQFQSHATMAAMRLGDYTGPTYYAELDALRAALEAEAGRRQ